MATQSETVQKLTTLAEQTCEREGCRLYDIEWVSGTRGRGRIVRVYVDRMDQPVSVGDCERVSHALSLLLDVEDIIPGGDYELEVSTPGLERRLTKPWHFQNAIDKQIVLKTNDDINAFNPELARTPGVKRQNAKGRVVTSSEETFVMDIDGRAATIPFKIVEKAHVVFDFDSTKGKKK